MYISSGLILLFTSLASLISSETFDDLKVKSGKICSNPPTSCVCQINQQFGLPWFTLFCTLEIVINFIQRTNDWLQVEFINVTSFDLIPDMTRSINSTGIILERCVINETINEITSKISKNVKNLEIKFTRTDKRHMTFNSKLFEGLSKLEILKITKLEKDLSIKIVKNVYDNLTNLKELELLNIPTPNGVFDRLENFKF